ncbi:MAG TPA: CBS domain-containing protein, partial [Halothiobacillaceae bacterium]|nr:CBS domain-containing protein [Halothiobacillaceae bacterium]
VSLVHQIMSAPAITIREDDSIAKMRAMLAEHNIGLLPVVDKNGDLSGIVTRGDLTRQQVRYQTLARLPVQQIAQRNVLVTSPNTNIRELARVLLEQDIRGLPVLDQEQTPPRIVGVVTRTDVLRAMVHYAPLELWL